MNPLKSNDLKWIGIDFDDVIAGNSGYPDYVLGEPLSGSKEALEQIRDNGWKAIIYTARPWSQYIVVEDYLNTHQIPFKAIVCGKVLLRWMIDDKNIEFHGDWKETLSKIK